MVAGHRVAFIKNCKVLDDPFRVFVLHWVILLCLFWANKATGVLLHLLWMLWCSSGSVFSLYLFLSLFLYRQYTHTDLTSWHYTVKRWEGRTMRHPCHTWIVLSSKYRARDLLNSFYCALDWVVVVGKHHLNAALPPLVASPLCTCKICFSVFGKDQLQMFLKKVIFGDYGDFHLCCCVCLSESSCPVMPWKITTEPASTSTRTTYPRSISQ